MSGKRRSIASTRGRSGRSFVVGHAEFSLDVVDEVEQSPRLPGAIAPCKREGTQDPAFSQNRDGCVNGRSGVVVASMTVQWTARMSLSRSGLAPVPRATASSMAVTFPRTDRAVSFGAKKAPRQDLEAGQSGGVSIQCVDGALGGGDGSGDAQGMESCKDPIGSGTNA